MDWMSNFSITNSLSPPYLSDLISNHSALCLLSSIHSGLDSVPQMCQTQSVAPFFFFFPFPLRLYPFILRKEEKNDYQWQ